MSESIKTVVYASVALVLGVLALATQPRASREPALFDDTGEPFSELVDPSVPTALEVVEYNDELSEAKPFRVHYHNNRWTIPSHHDYPADAEKRLAQTAGAIIGLTKDSVRSDRKEDHAMLGVVDPYESGAASTGWGTRVKLFDKDNNPLVDLIFGKPVENRAGFRFVRIPGKDRVYEAEVKELDLSTRFTDWIDTKLLVVASFDLKKIELKDYRVEDQKILDSGTTVLTKNDTNAWGVEGLPETEKTNEAKARDLANAIGELGIVGVRPKPEGMTPDLRVLEGQLLAQSMMRRGFYPVRGGNVVSNNGETLVTTTEGLVYTLRFGDLAPGTGDDLTAGAENEDPAASKQESPDGGNAAINRYLLVSVSFDENVFPPIPDPAPASEEKAAEGADAGTEKPADEAAEKTEEPAEAVPTAEEIEQQRKERDEKIAAGKKKAEEISKRYAGWYYVIAEDSFKKIHVSRADLVEAKTEEPAAVDGVPPADAVPPAAAEGAAPTPEGTAPTPEAETPSAPMPDAETPDAAKPEETPAPKSSEAEPPADSPEPATPPPDAPPSPEEPKGAP